MPWARFAPRMDAMTSPQFSRPGAMDLSALKNKAEQAASGPAGGSGGGKGSYVEQVGQETFNDLITRSQQYPIVVEFYSPRAQNADQLSQALISEAAAAQGRFLLARVNVDAAPQLAQAVGVEAVPTVLALMMGQALPLFQGVQPPEQVKAVIEQVLQAAVSNGLVGRVPAGEEAAGEAQEIEPESDPRFAEADAALERGDFAAAVAEFDKLLTADAGDAEAKAGRAQAALLARTVGLEAHNVLAEADAEPKNVPKALAAADVELVSGQAEQAFSRLIGLLRLTLGEDRELLRKRVLELFETLGAADPRVNKARRDLSSALF